MDKAYNLVYQEKFKSSSEKYRRRMSRWHKRCCFEVDKVYYCFRARMTQEVEYPIHHGSYETLLEWDWQSNDEVWYIVLYHRAHLDKEDPRTFWDYVNGDECVSLLTGIKAVTLKDKWLKLDAATKAFYRESKLLSSGTFLYCWCPYATY